MTMLGTGPLRRPSLRMSEAEFVKWAGSNPRSEWVDGEVVLKMPISEDHDEIQRLIAFVVDHFVRRRKLGKVRGPEFTTRLQLKDKVVRRDPDVMFVSNANPADSKPTYLDGPPDLAVEVVSPDSDFRDFHQKYEEYQAAGVGEYWIINPLGQTVHLFVRDPKAGEFVRREAGDDGRFRSAVLDGLWFHPDDLFAAERPDAFTLLKRIDPALID